MERVLVSAGGLGVAWRTHVSVNRSGFSGVSPPPFPFIENGPAFPLECGPILDYYSFDLCGNGRNEGHFRIVCMYYARLKSTEFSTVQERQDILVVCGRIVTNLVWVTQRDREYLRSGESRIFRCFAYALKISTTRLKILAILAESLNKQSSHRSICPISINGI